MKLYQPLLILSFLFTLISSCDSNGSDDLISQSESTSVGGEEIFAGLFFFEPDYIKHIPVLVNSTVVAALEKNMQIRENLEEVGNLIVNEISVRNPDFFDQFEFFMKSDNPYDVIEGIKLGSNELIFSLNTTFKDYDYSPEELLGLLTSTDIKNLIDENGKVDGEELSRIFEKDGNNFSLDSSTGKCVVAGVVLIAGVYLFVGAVVAIAAAVNIGVAVNVAAAVNAALAVNVDIEGDINFSGGGGDVTDPIDDEDEDPFTSMRLDEEVLIDQLVNYPY